MTTDDMIPRPLTDAMASARRQALIDLARSLKDHPPADRERFGDMVQAAFREGGLDPRDLSGDMGYSFSSVHRWIALQSAPHSSQWPTVTTWIVNRIEAMTGVATT